MVGWVRGNRMVKRLVEDLWVLVLTAGYESFAVSPGGFFLYSGGVGCGERFPGSSNSLLAVLPPPQKWLVLLYSSTLVFFLVSSTIITQKLGNVKVKPDIAGKPGDLAKWLLPF